MTAKSTATTYSESNMKVTIDFTGVRDLQQIANNHNRSYLSNISHITTMAQKWGTWNVSCLINSVTYRRLPRLPGAGPHASTLLRLSRYMKKLFSDEVFYCCEKCCSQEYEKICRKYIYLLHALALRHTLSASQIPPIGTSPF